jgi:protein phosphatase
LQPLIDDEVDPNRSTVPDKLSPLPSEGYAERHSTAARYRHNSPLHRARSVMKIEAELSASRQHDLQPGTAYGATDVGLARTCNEDNFLIDDTLSLIMLADGMGGHASGEIASAAALTALHAHLRSAIDAATNDMTVPGNTVANALVAAHDPDATWTDDTLPAAGMVFDAIDFANETVFQENVALDIVDDGGMGTTLTGMWRPFCGGPAIVFHVGDSRLYRYRNGQLTLLTVDQSLYQQALDAGLFDSLPARNMLWQAVGPAPRIKPDVKVYGLVAGDLFLLCSDGLHGSVAHADIEHVLSTSAADGLALSCQRLIDLAKEDGGRDNITVVLASFDAQA